MKVSLAAARVNAKLTQQQTAEQMGIDKSTVSNWENEKTSPTACQLLELCAIYNCTVDDIFLSKKST